MEENNVRPKVAGVILKQDNKYLLVQEKQPKAYGLWNFPAGHIDEGESAEEAAVREAKEEVGFDVEIVKQINTEELSKHAFFAKVVGGELRFPEDEIIDARWFSLEEITVMQDQMRSAWILDSIIALEKDQNKAA
jgi:8-oxo-dGTP diphosphatase